MTDTIKLSDLHIDKMNVRGAAKAEPDFIANIAARGVEQKLVVRPNGNGFGVVDGGKRLSALQALLAGGKIKADHPVPVDLRKGMTDAEARELSLTLNIVRADMHPVDSYRAFVQLNHDKTKPIDVDKLAARFGIERKEMDKIIALGGLSDVVLDAWRSGRISAAGAKVFTLCPSKKAQEIVFAKVDKRNDKDRQIDDWPIKQELKIGHNNPGRLLSAIDEAEYVKRGGKVTHDLFGTNHVVSDHKLLMAMVQEKIAATCKTLIEQGWSWATSDVPNNSYSYGKINGRDNAADIKKLEALNDKLQAAEEQFGDDAPEYDKLAAEHDALEQQIERDSFTKEQRAKAGCFVSLDQHRGTISVEYGRVRPADKAAAKAASAGPKAKGEKSKPKPATDLVSNALTQRLSEQLTAATAKAIARQPAEIVLAALLAGFASGETVRVEERGLSTVNMGRSASFESVFETQRKKTLREQHVALAQVAAAALDFQVQRSDDLPLKNKGVAALCSAIDGKAINAAIRESFDAADYFGAVGRSMIVRIVTEAMGADHARKVAAMKKPEATKFAIANVTKTGWLPMQLRTSHYDGPAAKAKAKKAPKAKANKKRK